jgi:hypothetical protein
MDLQIGLMNGRTAHGLLISRTTTKIRSDEGIQSGLAIEMSFSGFTVKLDGKVKIFF